MAKRDSQLLVNWRYEAFDPPEEAHREVPDDPRHGFAWLKLLAPSAEPGWPGPLLVPGATSFPFEPASVGARIIWLTPEWVANSGAAVTAISKPLPAPLTAAL